MDRVKTNFSLYICLGSLYPDLARMYVMYDLTSLMFVHVKTPAS